MSQSALLFRWCTDHQGILHLSLVQARHQLADLSNVQDTPAAAVKRRAAAKLPPAGTLRSGKKRKAEAQLPARRSGRSKRVL